MNEHYDGEELYDLVFDPCERRNLINHPDKQEVREDMPSRCTPNGLPTPYVPDTRHEAPPWNRLRKGYGAPRGQSYGNPRYRRSGRDVSLEKLETFPHAKA